MKLRIKPKSFSSRVRLLTGLCRKLYESVMSNVGLLIESKIHPFKCLYLVNLSK
jgi:hypothetical protein